MALSDSSGPNRLDQDGGPARSGRSGPPYPPRTVTVGGLPGTGTSTLCGLLERDLGLPYVYAGQLFRQEAARRGLSLAQLNELSQSDESVDRKLDELQLELLRRGGVILEGRMAGWFAKHHGIAAFKVWVECELDERVRRLVLRDGGGEHAQRLAILDREASERDRYLRYYGAELTDHAIYDLVLDSTGSSPAELTGTVVRILRGESPPEES